MNDKKLIIALIDIEISKAWFELSKLHAAGSDMVDYFHGMVVDHVGCLEATKKRLETDD